MSWATKERDKYVSVASVTGEIFPEKNDVRSFIIHEGETKLLKKLIDVFLKEIDNPMLVEINLEDNKPYKSEEIRFGGPRSFPSFYVNIDVFSEDVENIEAGLPFRMRFSTNVHPDSKRAFIEFFNNFSTILGW